MLVIVVWISKEAILCHKCFHSFECKVHFGCPMKCFLSRLTAERCKNVCALRPQMSVMVDSTKEAMHMWEVPGFCICRISSIFYAMVSSQWVWASAKASQFPGLPICIWACWWCSNWLPTNVVYCQEVICGVPKWRRMHQYYLDRHWCNWYCIILPP